MRIGLALPQYDGGIPNAGEITWEGMVEYARCAEDLGFDSLWVSDHLGWDLAKYGGPAERIGTLDPLVAMAALARTVSRPRLGTLVLCEALRPASVLAKALATIDRLSGGRVDVGLGAGWYEPDYAAIGMPMPAPGERLARLEEAVQVVQGLLDAGGATFSFAGRYHRAHDAQNHPPPLQRPRPPVFVGGKGDRLLALAARCADGWNTCWSWTPGAYSERVGVLDAACARVERDPASVSRSLGLYALCGEDRRDLERRFARLRDVSPPGVLDGVSLDEYRAGRLVGTVDEVREQAAEWAALGVETLVVNTGAVPFHAGPLDDLDPLQAALLGGT